MKYIIWILLITISLLQIGCDESESAQNIESEKTEVVSSEVVPVEAYVVKENIIEQKFPLTGVIKPNNSVDIFAEVSGKITSVNKELGDFVSKGQTLAIIDDIIPESQYKQAQAQVLSTKNNLEIVNSNLASDSILFKNKDISELQFNNAILAAKNAEAQYLSAVAQLSAAEKTYNDTRIKSPISGIVSRKNINIGTMASIGNNVYRVIDLSKMKLQVSVPQELINKVQINNLASVSVSALNGNIFEGKVKRISPQADEATGGFLVEIEIQNPERKIKAGMTAKLDLTLSNQKKVLTIPYYAEVSKNDESYVYKINNKIATLAKIEISETMGENTIIENGLSVGDTIVTVGMKNLGLNTKVAIDEIH